MKKRGLISLAVILVALVAAVAIVSPVNVSANDEGASTIVNTTTGTKYGTIQSAVNNAVDGDTISIGPGTYTEEVQLVDVKSITILGANAETVPVNNDADGTILTGGIFLGRDASKPIDKDVTIKGITFSGHKGLLLGNIQNVTVENNKFLNITETFNSSTTHVAAVAVIDPYAGGTTTIKNNYIDEVGNDSGAVGIYIRKPTTAIISGNHVEDIIHNAILLSGVVTNTNATVTGNKLINWDSDNDSKGGRALRAAVNADNFVFTDNCLVKTDWGDTPADPNFVKVTDLPLETNTVFDNNYWNSDAPEFNAILDGSSDNIKVKTYYSEEAMNSLVNAELAPTGLAGTAATSALNDGKITGTTENMEYKLASDEESKYTACSKDATTVPAAGDYVVRFAATERVNTGESTEVTVTVEYGIVAKESDADMTYVKTDSSDFVITSDADVSKFKNVYVDGKELASSNYSVSEGSTKVTFTKEYMDSLSEGTHTAAINSTDGSMFTEFTVEEGNSSASEAANNSNIPKTSDNSNILFWSLAIAAAAILVIALIVIKRRKNAK